MSIISRYNEYYDRYVPRNIGVTYVRELETFENHHELPFSPPKKFGPYQVTSFCVYFCGVYHMGKRIKSEGKNVCVYTFSDLVRELRGIHSEDIWGMEEDFYSGMSECLKVNKVVQDGSIQGQVLACQEVVFNAVLLDYQFEKVNSGKLAASQVVSWLQALQCN